MKAHTCSQGTIKTVRGSFLVHVRFIEGQCPVLVSNVPQERCTFCGNASYALWTLEKIVKLLQTCQTDLFMDGGKKWKDVQGRGVLATVMLDYAEIDPGHVRYLA